MESRRLNTGTRSLLSAKVTAGNRTTSSYASNIEENSSSTSPYISKVENPDTTYDNPQTDLNSNGKKSADHHYYNNNNVHPENTIQKFSRTQIKEDTSADEHSPHQEIPIDKTKMDEIKPIVSFNNENSSSSTIKKDDYDIDRGRIGQDGLQKSQHISNLPRPTKSTADAETHSSDKAMTQTFPSMAPSAAAESMKINNKSTEPPAGLPSLHDGDSSAAATSVEKDTQQYVAGNILDSHDLDISASSPFSSSTEVGPKPESNSSASFIHSFANLPREEVQQTEEGNDYEEGGGGRHQQLLRTSQTVIGHPLVSKFITPDSNETIVNVNIGRIEIRAVTPSQRTAALAATTSADQVSTSATTGAYSPPLSLAEYLKQRADEAKGKR